MRLSKFFSFIAVALLVAVLFAGLATTPATAQTDTTTWQSLGGYLTSSPAATSPTSGATDVFVRGGDDALWWRHWNGQDWSAWTSLGGVLTADPAAVSGYASGRIDVFVRGGDGGLWSRYTTDGGTSWSGWHSIGGQLLDGTGPTAYAWANDRIGWLVTGMNHALYHMWNDAAGTHGWEKLDGYLTSSPGATSPSSGVIDVFVRGGSGALWQREYNNGWQSWTSLGGVLAPGTGPAACSWGSGRLDVFVEGMSGALYHQSYASATWSDWESLGGYLTSSPAAATAPGSSRIDVFVRGGDNGLWWKPYLVGYPIVGSFSGTSVSLPGANTDTGTGLFTYVGWSNVKGSQIIVPSAPYKMTITTAKGSINLHVPSVGLAIGSTYYIDGGTGEFARVSGGSGHFSLDRVWQGIGGGTFTGNLDGTIVLA